MAVRCPACHSDQTKPAPARNFLERFSGLLGRRAYFCEDCYRRFTPGKFNSQNQEEASPPVDHETLEEPQAAMRVEGPLFQGEHLSPLNECQAEPLDEYLDRPRDKHLEPLPVPPREAAPEPVPTTAHAEPRALGPEPEADLELAPSPTPVPPPFADEDSLVSRMRRQQMAEEQQRVQDQEEGKNWLSSLPLSPVKLGVAAGGALLVIVLILWYRSSLEQAPRPTQASTTRVKINDGAAPAQAPAPARIEAPPSFGAPGAPSEVPSSPPTPPGPSASTPSETLPTSPGPASAPFSQPIPAAPVAQAPPEPPAPPSAPTPPAPSRRVAPPAPAAPSHAARTAPTAKAKRSAMKPGPALAKTQGNYAVQFGAFNEAARAQSLAAKLKAKGLQVHVTTVKGRDGKVWHKVRSIGLATQDEAQRVQRKLEQTGGVKGMVVRIKP